MATGRNLRPRAPAPRWAPALQRALLRAGRRRAVRTVASAGYELTARAYARWLLRGVAGATAYLRGGLAQREVRPGFSDVDLALVVPDRAAAARAQARHVTLERRAPWLAQAVLEVPRIYAGDDLDRIAGHSMLTFPGAAFAPGGPRGIVRHLQQPGVTPAAASWRRLHGPERRPPEPPRDAETQRLAAWLEVQYVWRFAWTAFDDALPPPRAADVMANVVLRSAAACRGLGVAAGDVAVAERIRRDPASEPPDAMRRLLGAALRLADAVAAEVEGAAGGGVAVRLAAAGGALSPRLPLADWHAVVVPDDVVATFALHPGDASDPRVLAAALGASGPGHYAALRFGRLLLLAPARFGDSQMRAIQCSATDPVSFALLRGGDDAHFPAHLGLSAHDWARRAIAEQREAHDRTHPQRRRAEDFARSLKEGEPVLRLTP
ncbi:MAG TPA: hypothetical protein VF529_22440 [Solirubrobacteraceae bacterium]|jgi:hypothetical protein